MVDTPSDEEDLEFEEGSSEADADEIDEDLLDAVEAATSEAGGSDVEEGNEMSEDEDEDSDEDDEESPPTPAPHPVPLPPQLPVAPVRQLPIAPTALPPTSISLPPKQEVAYNSLPDATQQRSPSPIRRDRSPSPAALRRADILASVSHPKSYTVEAICAIPHPVPTHALASSLCLTHLLTGSHDGYVRDYDLFAAVNGKNFLTAQQRHHCGVIEGTMKAAPIRCWWENPVRPRPPGASPPETNLAPVYSMAMHSDALWTLTGAEAGHINLFLSRHEPGKLMHTFSGHRNVVSALSIAHDEQSFFSAGWDGVALQWDLNTGQIVRDFVAHGAQLAAIAVRPVAPVPFDWDSSPIEEEPKPSTSIVTSTNDSSEPSSIVKTEAPTNGDADVSMHSASVGDVDVRSEASYDPLFDDEPDGLFSEVPPVPWAPAMPGDEWKPPQVPIVVQPRPPPTLAPKMPPLLGQGSTPDFSPNVIMTAAVDGQVVLWDLRVSAAGQGVGRLFMHEKTPPWCMSACWSADGGQIYAGRRNGTIDVWDLRQLGRAGPKGIPRLLKTIRNPISSGVVSCVAAFPDGKHIACASTDNIRLWNAAEAGESSGRGAQFKIIPGHHGGYVSQILVDPCARFLISASSNRGWHGESSKTVFVHEIRHIL